MSTAPTSITMRAYYFRDNHTFLPLDITYSNGPDIRTKLLKALEDGFVHGSLIVTRDPYKPAYRNELDGPGSSAPLDISLWLDRARDWLGNEFQRFMEAAHAQGQVSVEPVEAPVDMTDISLYLDKDLLAYYQTLANKAGLTLSQALTCVLAQSTMGPFTMGPPAITVDDDDEEGGSDAEETSRAYQDTGPSYEQAVSALSAFNAALVPSLQVPLSVTYRIAMHDALEAGGVRPMAKYQPKYDRELIAEMLNAYEEHKSCDTDLVHLESSIREQAMLLSDADLELEDGGRTANNEGG